MLPSTTASLTECPMDQIVRRLETLHRALRAAPENAGDAPRVAEAVAACLGDLHAIAARAAQDADRARPRLRLIDGATGS
jgi:hypothetical protein